MDSNLQPDIGDQLRLFRKRRYPKDDQKAFAFRIGVSRATLQKMEKGDLSVSMQSYFSAARLFGIEDRLLTLFVMPRNKNLFDELYEQRRKK
ncbi:helix-turn-helix transcriptional regulator [uncultured Methylophaga sp.]|uniref:helix-turn-helix domain-containing protein n=1 Tax=uncultured Methylophaga sp. TaxID=285271 RepID=UPI00344B2B54